ncbi:uncharacterized protein LOC144133822 [Amblyomma americanum]
MDFKNARIKRDAVPTQNLSPGAPPKKRRRFETLCANHQFLTWSSQPMINDKAAGNVLMSAAMLFAGTSPTSVPRMFNYVNVQVFTSRTFYNYQRGYLLPAIDKEELFRQLEGCTVDLAGDGRCDSPGFCAKFLTYSLHVAQLNKILHFEQVQVGECADVQSSTSMEKFAFVKSLNMVKERGLKVASVTTDRHGQVTKYMRTQEPTIRHYYDCWHISKGIKKKLAAHAKRAGCSVLEIWIQPASNHLYWCAALSDGSAELLTDMWKSMERHAANMHTGHPGLYTTQLAILHFNENAIKGQATTAEGLSRWKINHPKARKDYVGLLLKETVYCSEQWPSFKAAFAENLSTAPPPMSHSFPRPSKNELVAARRSRFASSMGSTTV